MNAAPTSAPREFFNELQREYQTRLAEANKFISEQAPRLNETLRKHGAPTVIVSKPS